MEGIRFRRFDYEQDSKRVFEYMMREENQLLFSHTFQCHTLPMFREWLTSKFANHSYHDFFIIVKSDDTPIGFTFSYEFFANDKHCKFTLCLFEEYQDHGFGAVAGIQMIDYLFRRYSLNRIFISIFDFNKQSLSCNKSAGFEEVGLLPEYRYCNGSLYSLHILTITRNAFYEKHTERLARMKSIKTQNIY